ncbi:predicted protein [Histoplasma capsulatum H143]|uniref:Uncharacterized protein n=1 Tax=Ajellomyces capsulatus (strain H143) TaxID=544712 RepID=C6H911_AJECH|nr:predicted protein [Histoplasma capsulatum H143]
MPRHIYWQPLPQSWFLFVAEQKWGLPILGAQHIIIFAFSFTSTSISSSSGHIFNPLIHIPTVQPAADIYIDLVLAKGRIGELEKTGLSDVMALSALTNNFAGCA